MNKALVLIVLSCGIMTANDSSGEELDRDTAATILTESHSWPRPSLEIS